MSAKTLIWILVIFAIGFGLLALAECGYRKLRPATEAIRVTTDP